MGAILDKNQSQELILSLILILLGIFLWVSYFLIFQLHFYNVISLKDLLFVLILFIFQASGTITILIGLIIVHRVYPFPYSIIGIILVIGILIINILDLFLYKFEVYREFQLYRPFIMSIVAVILAKLIESGIRYFGNQELTKKWEYICVVIFFGFSIPYYLYATFNLLNFIKFDVFKFNLKFLGLSIPLILVYLSLFLYFLLTIIMSFRFLWKVKNKTN